MNGAEEEQSQAQQAFVTASEHWILPTIRKHKKIASKALASLDNPAGNTTNRN